MELKMAFHSVTGRRIVEVYDNGGRFVAAIYPDEASNGVKIVSRHFGFTRLDIDGLPPAPALDLLYRIPALNVTFKRQP